MDRVLYDQALFNYHKDISEKDMEEGLYETYSAPDWLSLKLANDIMNEIDEYVNICWIKNS